MSSDEKLGYAEMGAAAIPSTLSGSADTPTAVSLDELSALPISPLEMRGEVSLEGREWFS